ncbi:MAG: ABC transporter permease [Coriobacteriia bacterium]
MLPFKIATRFLRTSPVQSALIMAGIAVGIATQVFVGSLITSLQDSLVTQTIGSTSQITITALDDGEPMVVDSRIMTVVTADPRVEPNAMVAVRSANALYSDGDESAPLALKGGEFAGLDAIYSISSRMVEGQARLGSGDVILGLDFARKFALSPGEKMSISFSDGSKRSLTVAGIVDLGAAVANERQAFVSEDLPRALLGWRADEYAAVEVQLLEPFDSTDVAADWQGRLRELKVTEWQEQNADLLVALQSQSSSSYMIQGFVLVAVALGIASTLAISAVQKTRQIGILKAMGLDDRRAGRIFLWQATLLGAGGTLGGVALGFLLLWGFSFAPTTFSISPEPTFIAISASVGMLVALSSSIIPARRTSRVDPIEVIQSA